MQALAGEEVRCAHVGVRACRYGNIDESEVRVVAESKGVVRAEVSVPKVTVIGRKCVNADRQRGKASDIAKIV